MNFWEHQDRARRKTKWLVLYFLTAVILIVVAVYACLVLVMGIGEGYLESSRSGGAEIQIWQPELFFWTTLATLGVIAIGSAAKVVELAGDGGKVAVMLGGKPLNPATTDPEERQLQNVVEEMAIASGTPVPDLYILDSENGINAFAAGNTPAKAAIGVTRGTLRHLNRDELQGVIAHEFSHILNGDMRLNLRLIGILNGILCLAILGRILLHVRGERNPVPLLGLALLALGGIGLLFGRLIKSAVSRQREYLADAAAVQFTRHPDGIAGALKKIGGLVRGSRLDSPAAEEASHMFFGNGLAENWSQAFATHPPLAKRIRAIDPSFDGKFPRLELLPPSRPHEARRVSPRRPSLGGAAAGFTGAAATSSPPPDLHPDAVTNTVASPSQLHLDYASDFLEELSESVRQAVHDPLGACAVVYGLLLDSRDTLRQTQLSHLHRTCRPAVIRETHRMLPHLAHLDRAVKLPLVDLALPALRQLSPEQFNEFQQNVRVIIESDRQIDLFEYALQRALIRHLTPHFKPARKSTIKFHSLKTLIDQSSVLLSGLARVGQASEPEIRHAFQAGASRLDPRSPRLRLLDPEACNLPQIDAALEAFSRATPPIKKRLLDALARTVAADQLLRPREAELLRAIADTLDCPLPPFLTWNDKPE